MRKDWESKRLEDCFRLKSGDNLTSKNMNTGKYPVFGGNGIAGAHNNYNLSGDNVIIGRVGAQCGNVRRITEKIWLTDNAFKIVDYNCEFDNSFLTYLLNYKDLRNYARQAAQPVISNSSLKDVILEFPKSLSEQKQIVAILDKAFAAIDKAKANAEQNLKNAKELFESYLNEVFENKGDDWEEKSLGEVCMYDKESNRESNLPYVGLEHIESNTGKFIGILAPQKVKSTTFSFSTDHVLYGRLRPYLNKVLIPDFKGHCSTEIFPIRPNKELNRDFLFYWLLSSNTVSKIDSTWTGARMPRANMNTVLTFDFYLPSLDEQKKIVKKLEKLNLETDKLSVYYQQYIEDLEELKKSILQKAFSGELTNKPIPELA